MGWDGVYGKFPGSKKFIETEAKFTEYDVVAHALKGNNLWAVIQHKTSGERSAILFLLRRYATEYDYKVMGESMHPYYYDIPERLFKMLTPTTNEYALTWRAEVEQILQKVKSNKAKPMGAGTLFKINGSTHMVVEKEKKTLIIQDLARNYWRLSVARFRKEALIVEDGTGQGKLF